MKILLSKYPKGSYKGQQTNGKYIDGYLHDNLKILAKRIVDDMTFLGVIFSSTLEVGTGKSVLATQLGEAWSEIMWDMHKINVPFGMKNIVWRPKELIERAFDVPQYSFILLDEWEDATYWSQLGMTLRQFFRKCRQLNLFMIIIIPNWFQLNLSYAVSRSVFAIDVKFERDFARGYFSFYSFAAKRVLYIKGKKEHNYRVVKPTFNGQFVNGYGVPDKEYRKAKQEDMMSYDMEEAKPLTELQIKMKIFKQIRKNIPFTQKLLAKCFGISVRTATRWMRDDFTKESGDNKGGQGHHDTYNKYPIMDKEIKWDEQKIEKELKKNEE